MENNNFCVYIYIFIYVIYSLLFFFLHLFYQVMPSPIHLFFFSKIYPLPLASFLLISSFHHHKTLCLFLYITLLVFLTHFFLNKQNPYILFTRFLLNSSNKTE